MPVTCRPVFRLVTAALALVPLISCSTVPETKRPQLILIDKQKEESIGEQTYREVLAKSRISRDARLISIVERVGRAIAVASGADGMKWEFNLIESEAPNAFCMPGGKVAVNTGILPIAENEAGLAAVMGHEIAHAVARHGAERLSQANLADAGKEFLAEGLGIDERVKELIRKIYGAGVAVVFTLPYSRYHEFEADHLGVLYMARAGYDPREAVKFWERFREYGENAEPEGKSGFLSAHPVHGARIDQITSVMPEAMAEYERGAKKGYGEPLF
ncbi:MAG: M48 family metallopeptidase [Nitrospinae bacterium]|nr:M48 family metallopeptidase [Nitrospinota bacterium]